MKIITSEEAGPKHQNTRAVHVWISPRDDWRVTLVTGHAETPIATINGNSARSRRLAAYIAANVADSGIGIDTIIVDGLSITEHVAKAVAAIA
jgi:hypothetical protein